MENSTSKPSGRCPNSISSFIEELASSLARNLLVTPPDTNSLVSSCIGGSSCSTATQQTSSSGFNFLKNPLTVPTPLYSQGIWATSNADSSISQSGANASLVPSNYVNGYNLDNIGQDRLVINQRKSLLMGNAAANYVQVPQGIPSFGLLSQGIDNVGVMAQQDGLRCALSDGELLEYYSFLTEATSREGSFKLQEKLKAGDPETTRKIFDKAYLLLFRLICDPYGGYVFTRLVEACSQTQLELIIWKVHRNPELFIYSACTIFGSKAVRRLIKLLQKSPMISVVILILSSSYFDLMVHSIGRHVVIKSVKLLKPEQLKLLYLQAIKFCPDLAQHREGCISLNELITHSQGPYKEILQRLIASHAVYLSYDPYGNYVIQNVLQRGSPFCTKEICSRLRNHYADLSVLKGGSHVVEKCLNSIAMECVVEELLRSKKLQHIARNEYGNYVIQTALKTTKHSNTELHRRLSERLQQDPKALQSQYGKNVLRLIVNGIPID